MSNVSLARTVERLCAQMALMGCILKLAAMLIIRIVVVGIFDLTGFSLH